jgi:hypothetical protein
MRVPSIKTLTTRFPNLSRDEAKLIRALGHATDDGEKLRQIVEELSPKTAAYVRSMHGEPWSSHMWRVTVALHAMDVVLGTFGVEGLGPTSGPSYAPPYEYLNAGDTYATTLIYRNKTDTLSVGNWGDIAERHPNWE